MKQFAAVIHTMLSVTAVVIGLVLYEITTGNKATGHQVLVALLIVVIYDLSLTRQRDE